MAMGKNDFKAVIGNGTFSNSSSDKSWSNWSSEWNEKWANPWDPYTPNPKEIYPYIPGPYTDNTTESYHGVVETIRREFDLKIENLERQIRDLQEIVKTMITNDKIKVKTIEAKKIILITEDGEIELDKETVEKFIEENSPNKFKDILSK